MNQSVEIDQPYEGQKFKSFDDLKKYLEEYGQRNYVKFWIRSSHTRNSLKSKISKRMNPELKYVSVKFACIFGGEKIRCRGSGIRKSSTYRNLGCPCMINAVVGEDGNHVKLDTVILEHNHVLCKTLYDSLKKTKRKSQTVKNNKESIKNFLAGNSDLKLFKNDIYVPPVEDDFKKEPSDKMDGNVSQEKSDAPENCLKDIEDKYGRIVKILVINSENKNGELKPESKCGVFRDENFDSKLKDEPKEFPEICRLCLSSKDKLSPIFNPDLPLESTVLSFKIMGCASIEISCNDGLPNSICSKCEANLDIAYNFRIRCENSDSILRETYSRSKTLPLKEDWENHSDEEGSNEDNSSQETLVSYPELGDEKEDPSARVDFETSSQKPFYVQFAISCPVCGFDFETYESMLDHLGSHADDETLLLACNICTLVCPTVIDLQEHMGEHLKETASELWTCTQCETSFATEEELKLHEACHETAENRVKKQSEVKYLCNVCGKIFKTKDRFQAHRNIHEGLRPHVCLACGRGFADRKNLHQHYDVVHLRKVRHECPVCQRKFYTRTKMKSHMTMHSGVKPFACDVCNKTFRLKMNMNKHKKTHTNFRPYRCDKCNAAFMEKNLLRRHSYKHGGIRPFQCPVCGHGFSAKFCLKKHLKDSKCRGVVIADPDSYQWVGMSEPESNLSESKCVVVYKAEEGSGLQEDADTINMNILEEFKEESNS